MEKFIFFHNFCCKQKFHRNSDFTHLWWISSVADGFRSGYARLTAKGGEAQSKLCLKESEQRGLCPHPTGLLALYLARE
jgi:hypothetical protein